MILKVSEDAESRKEKREKKTKTKKREEEGMGHSTKPAHFRNVQHYQQVIDTLQTKTFPYKIFTENESHAGRGK